MSKAFQFLVCMAFITFFTFNIVISLNEYREVKKELEQQQNIVKIYQAKNPKSEINFADKELARQHKHYAKEVVKYTGLVLAVFIGMVGIFAIELTMIGGDYERNIHVQNN
jgi:hypothetical protein